MTERVFFVGPHNLPPRRPPEQAERCWTCGSTTWEEAKRGARSSWMRCQRCGRWSRQRRKAP
jgi:hypothetical protein